MSLRPREALAVSSNPSEATRAGMPIRVRLALCFAAVCGAALFSSGVLGYAFHTRGHYDDLDRVLIKDAEHVITESGSPNRPVTLNGTATELEVALRLYGSDGKLREQSRDGVALPPVSPRAVLAQPAGPAFDLVSRLVPALGLAAPSPGSGAFGLLESNGQRWRSYVMPIRAGQAILGYVEALSPLGRLDTSVARLRLLLTALGLISLMGALAVSWLVAGRVLKPISAMTRTADEIARSRTLTRRVAVPPYRDELGHLAQTFNGMLSSLERASDAQQRFVSDASHELRAPLTVIQGNLQFLHRRPGISAEERAEVVAEAERETTRMSRLVAELLTLARSDAGVAMRRDPIELEAVVLSAFQEARHLVRGQQLELEQLEPARVEGDEDRLRQLLLILLDNALKYTPEGGKVSLGLRRRGAQVELTVRDTGIGIAEAALPRVFERFYRADPARGRDPGGFGLGLPIARWIVEGHGGTIQLESSVGAGTVATVRLPFGP